MAHPEGFEPPTARFVAEYSIQLSYGCTIKMAVREGFKPSMQLLTTYSLSRGAPSVSRPPHHKNRNEKILNYLSVAWRSYYFAILRSQTIF